MSKIKRLGSNRNVQGNHDIYTGDDGILTHNIEKMLGKYVYVSVDCSLTHPSSGENEKEYTEWKGKKLAEGSVKIFKSRLPRRK